MNNRPLALLVALSGLAASATAQAPRDSSLTLGRAIAMARQHSPLVMAAAGRGATSRGRASSDGAFPNPTLEWRRENDGSPLLPDVFTVLTLPVDLTGRRLMVRSAGRTLVERGRADSAGLTRQAEYDAARAWWRTVLAQGLLDVAREQRLALQGIAEFDARRFREGAVAELVAIRTRLEADRARLHEASAVADWAKARTELARSLGTVPDSLSAVPMPVGRDARPPIARDAALAALTTRPDVRAARLAVREAEQRATAEKIGVLAGDVQLVGGQKRTSGYTTAVISAVVPIPLFNRNSGNRERAAGELMMARADLRDVESRARGDVLGSLDAWQALQVAAPTGPEAIAAAGADVAAITEAAYREGGASLLELLESQRARADARAAALRWAVDAALLRIDLDRAVGASLPEQP